MIAAASMRNFAPCNSGAETMSTPISRFPVPTLDSLPEDLRQRILDVQAKAGFVPNVFFGFAHRPEEARAFFAYHDALVF